jgi:hypothetical protein
LHNDRRSARSRSSRVFIGVDRRSSAVPLIDSVHIGELGAPLFGLIGLFQPPITAPTVPVAEAGSSGFTLPMRSLIGTQTITLEELD